MADQSESRKTPSTNTGDEKSTRKRLQRTLTRILSIRRPSKGDRSRSGSVSASPAIEEPSAGPSAPSAPPPEPEDRKAVQPPVPPAVGQEAIPIKSLDDKEEGPPPVPQAVDRETIPIKSLDDNEEGPPPVPQAVDLETIPIKSLDDEEEGPPPVPHTADRETVPIKSLDDKEEGPPPVQSAAERAESSQDWSLSAIPQCEHVYKEIRMRIHRTCHKCHTGYGPETICIKCGHRRCKQCPRVPIKKPPHEKSKHDKGRHDKGKQKEGARPKKPLLTIPNPRGGPDLVRKQIKQRVHRTCHRCKTAFGCEKICTKCNHTRCKKCPRDPRKKSKPPGYYEGRDPSDSEKEVFGGRPKRVYRKKKQRVHWICSSCNSTFEEHNRICPGCGSNRNVTGVRHPPQRNQNPNPNPNTVIPSDSEIERIQQQLQAL